MQNNGDYGNKIVKYEEVKKNKCMFKYKFLF